MTMQLCGTEEVRVAIERGDSVSLILVKRGNENQAVKDIISIAEKLDIRVIEGSENDLWRMARNNSDGTPDVLALVGRNPSASFEEVLESGGLIWMLDGAKYPVNIGFCIRTAEVSGADAVIVGSAYLKLIEKTKSTELESKITSFTKSLKKQTIIQ